MTEKKKKKTAKKSKGELEKVLNGSEPKNEYMPGKLTVRDGDGIRGRGG